MFIRNYDEALSKEKLFYCKSPNLTKFLVKMHDICYINKETNGDKHTWIFLKTPSLDVALSEWSNNKKNGTLAFKSDK